MEKPLISVIVLNWNGLNVVGDCLMSLREQTFREFEVIVVDNGSTDGSRNFVIENFPETRSVSLEKNYGFCGGNNHGFKYAKGDFLALLNNDAFADREWLKELYNGIISSPAVGFCASKILFFDSREYIDSAGDGFGICGVGFKRGHRSESYNFSLSEEVFGACGAGVIFKRAMLEDIGFFDEDLFLIHEDVDLSFRARLRGFKCLFIPSALIYHKCNETLGRFSDSYVYYGQRNLEIVYLKNMPLKFMIRYFHHHIFYNFLAFFYFLFKGKGWVFLRAKLDFLRMLPIILRKRRQIQGSRVVAEEEIGSLLERRWLRSRLGGKC